VHREGQVAFSSSTFHSRWVVADDLLGEAVVDRLLDWDALLKRGV